MGEGLTAGEWLGSGGGGGGLCFFFFFNDTATTEIYTLSLHDALPIFAHQHEKNPDYNSVVLHVVLYHHGQRKIEREDGRNVPELELAPFLSKEPSTSEMDARANLKLFEELPGRCGVAAVEHGAETLKRVIGHAAEQRIQEKTQVLLNRWEEQNPEELLFQLLFKSLGYSAFSQVFEELAKQYQFRKLRPLFRQPQRTTRTLVLSRWFGACGLFTKKLTISDPTVRHEFLQWKAAWQELPEHPKVSGKISQASRPQNSPEIGRASCRERV